MNSEQSWQVANLMTRTDHISGQVDLIWRTLERWDAEQSRDQATLRAMLAVIALLLVALGAGILWAEERAHGRADARIQALELRVEKLEFVAGGE